MMEVSARYSPCLVGTDPNWISRKNTLDVIDLELSSINKVNFSLLIFFLNVLLSFPLQAFGQTFTQTDITVFKQNLQSLEDLNSKRKLYQKVSVLTYACKHETNGVKL